MANNITQTIVASLISLIIGIFIGEPVKHCAKRLLQKKDTEIDRKHIMDKLSVLMPNLLKKMKEDLEENHLNRKFVIMSNKAIYNGKTVAYYFEDHDDLRGKMDVLENYGLIENITDNNTIRYRISEQFVEMLNKH